LILRRRLLAPLFVAVAASLIIAIPAVADPATGIDDEGLNPDAPGAIIVREVGSSNSVVVRLNNNFRTAKFKVLVRGVDVVGVDDEFPGAKGLEGEWQDGIVGPCRDEFRTNMTVTGNKTNVGKATFYTCQGPDSIRIHLGAAPELDPSSGVDAAIKIVFIDDVDNVDGVFVGLDPTNVGETWVPLYAATD
jgi:hypothetical protein